MATIRQTNKLAVLLTLLLLVASSAVCGAQQPAGCGRSTVDDNHDPQYSAKAKQFLATLQHAVQQGDQTQFAALVRYPLRVNGARARRVATSGELMKQYSQLMTPEMKRAILAQSVNCLFANGQGVMIGDGEVWFEENSAGQMKITSINPPAPASPQEKRP